MHYRGKFGSPYSGKGTAAAARAALPIPVGVCSIFVFSNNGMAASVWDFLTCAQLLMHAIAHGVCTDTVRESALEVYAGRKILCRTWPGTRARVSIAPGVSVSRSIN